MTSEERERLARLRIYAASHGVVGDEADRADAIADMENAENEDGYSFLLRLLDAATADLAGHCAALKQAMRERDEAKGEAANLYLRLNNVIECDLRMAKADVAALQTEIATFYGVASQAASLVKAMASWMHCDLNSEGEGPSGGRRSRAEKAELAVTAVCALEDRHERLWRAVQRYLDADGARGVYNATLTLAMREELFAIVGKERTTDELGKPLVRG